MEQNFKILLNGREINCNNDFIESNFPEFYKSSSSSINQKSIQIDGGDDFYEITKDIFQGIDYEITNENFAYLSELSQQVKSDGIQTKLNIFYYKHECNDNQIDQHPSIQFLVELSSLIHNISLSNYEDVSSQIKQKLIPSDAVKKLNSEKQSSDQEKTESENSEEEDSEAEEEKTLSLKMIGNREFNKLLYFEIVNSLSTGFDSIKNFQERKNKVDLIFQLIKDLDNENRTKLNSIDKNEFLNSFINYVIRKYKKLQQQRCSLMNYQQETKYLIHFLLSQKLITLSQIFQEDDPIELYFLEFFDESQIKAFLSKNKQIVDFIKNELKEPKTKSKSKKNRSSNDDEDNESLFADFLSKSIRNGILQDNELINVFLNDDLKKFKELFNNESINSYNLPDEISAISCLSALNDCSLFELSAYFGSEKIFAYLNDKNLKKEIRKPYNLHYYVIIGQQPRIIKLFLNGIDSNDTDSIFQMLSFCNDHHFNDTYEMIINSIENRPKITNKQLDQYMKRCVSRGYFDIIPKLLKEGATADTLLNLFSKANNEIGIEYMLDFSYINVNNNYNNKTPLEYCIDDKNERGSILLLKNDSINIQEIDNKSSNGETILHTSCRIGLPKVVSYLLRKHLYDVNSPNVEGVCPIHFACGSGSYETAETVIHTKNVHIRAKVKSGEFMKRTALHFACCSGNANIIILLLDSDSKLGLDNVDSKGRTPIIYAIKGDFADCIQVLLEKDVDIDQEYKGNNLLQYACIKNKFNAFNVLLNSIVFDPNQPCANGRSILHVAIEYKNLQMVEAILDKFSRSIDVNIVSNGKTPLIIACELGEVEIVKLLLDQNLIDADKPDSNGTTPFMAAAMSGKVEILKLLIDEGVDIYKKNNAGMSAIYFAIHSGKPDATKFLLPYFKDNLNDKIQNGETLLQIACKIGNIQLTKFLINYPGVDINVHDNNGYTPFLSGVKEGKFELIKALIESNECDMSEKSNDGKNAFLIAIESQNLDLIKFFIDLYANNSKTSKSKGKNKSKNKLQINNFVDINAKSSDGRTALFIALKMKNKEILQELISCPLIDINETSRNCTFISKIVKKLSKKNSRDSFNYLKILDLVLERKDLDINKPSSKYYDQTCLHIACSSQTHNMLLFKKLLAIDGVDINVQSKEGTPLFLLIKYQNKYFNYDPKNDLIPNLIEANNENNDSDNSESEHENNDSDNSESEHENNEKKLINSENKEQNYWHDFLDNPKLDINKGGYPAFNNNEEEHPFYMRQLLKQTKANEQEYLSPLEFAIANNYVEIYEALLSKKKIDINCNNNLKKRTPLHMAIAKNNLKLIKQIISNKKVKLNIQDEEGSTPLLLAINSNSNNLTELILYLLNKKEVLEGINIPDKSNKRTPFLASTLNPNTEIFSALLALDCVELDSQDKKGRTGLYLLVKNTRSGIIKDALERIVMLLDKCPSILNIPTKAGKTPLLRLLEFQNYPKISDIILYFLDQKNIDLSVSEYNSLLESRKVMGKITKNIKEKIASLLHLACSRSIPNVVEKLIPLTIKYYKEKGINENIFTQKDVHGNTILNVACSTQNKENANAINAILNYVKNNIDCADPNEFDINLESSNNVAPLHAICSMKESKETLEALNNILSFKSCDINAISSKELRTALHYACLYNNKGCVEALINFAPDSIDPNIYDNQGNTPLLIAVSQNESSIVKRLLKLDSIKVNLSRYLTNETPLYTACDLWNLKIVKRLLDDQRVDPNCHLHPSGKTPLMHSIEKNKIDLFEIFLSNDRIDLNAVDNDHLNVLHHACKTGRVEFVKKIIERKIKADKSSINDYLNSQTAKKLTPLHYACLSNSKNVILYLLELNDEEGIKIDINIRDDNNLAPFDIYLNNQAGFIDQSVSDAFLKANNKKAIHVNANIPEILENSHFGTIKFVISDDLSFDPNNNDNEMKWTLLHILCKRQNIDLLQIYLQKIDQLGIDVNAVDINKMTPLHHAVKVGYDSTIVKMLLDTNKCDLNIKDIKGRTVLHYACEMGKTQIIDELMKYSNDIDINAKDNNGSTILHEVANSLRFDVNILKMLFNSKCDPNIADKEGNTPLHIACLKENNSFVSSLIELSPIEIDVNAINNKYQTPLFIVCMMNDLHIFNTLFSCKLAHKIDINLTSPIYIAAIKESILVEKLLEMPGIDLNSNKKENQLSSISDESKYDFSGLNLMHILSCSESTHLLKKLIQANQFDINEPTSEFVEDKMNGTPLIIALKNKKLKNLHLLLDNYSTDLDLTIYDKKGLAAIHYCLQLGSVGVNILTKLIKIDDSIINMKTKDSLKLTPLLFAFQNNNLDCINPLLEQQSIDIFSIGNKHNTLVHYACIEKKRNDILDFILAKIKESKKNWQDIVDFINIENDDGKTALMLACENANFYAVKSLINTFRDSLDFSISDDGETPFLYAIKSGDDNLIKLLLLSDKCIQNIDISKPVNDNNDYIITLLAKNSNLENIKLLIDQCLSYSSDINFDFVNAKNNRGESLITVAAEKGNIDLFDYICETQNPDLNIFVDDEPLLFHAAREYNFDVFKSIIEHGSFDLNQMFKGETVLHVAVKSHDDSNEKVEYLVSNKNVDVNCTTKRGSMTPLHIAIKEKKIGIIETLLNLSDRIDLHKLNSKKKSPLQMGKSSIRKVRILFEKYENN